LREKIIQLVLGYLPFLFETFFLGGRNKGSCRIPTTFLQISKKEEEHIDTLKA
jgi:hypothetical protein